MKVTDNHEHRAGKRDNAVGYGNPPIGHRFKPGQSGNKNGRPKGSKSFATALAEELARIVTISEGGCTKKMTKQQILVKQLVNEALRNNAKA